MSDKYVKLPRLEQEAIERMTRTVLERLGRSVLIAEMTAHGATVDLDPDGNYRVVVAGEIAARISPYRVAEFVAKLDGKVRRLN